MDNNSGTISNDKAKVIYVIFVVLAAAIVTILQLLTGEPTGESIHFAIGDGRSGGITVLLLILKLVSFICSVVSLTITEIIISAIPYSINKEHISISFAVSVAIIVAFGFSIVTFMLDIFGVYSPNWIIGG